VLKSSLKVSSLPTELSQGQCQSQSYFTSGGLPPIGLFLLQAPWEPRPVFFKLNTCGYSPYITFSLEDGPVVYNCCWSSSAQSFSGLSREWLMTIFYRHRLETSPTWRSGSPYLYPPGTGRNNYNPRHWISFSSSSELSQSQKSKLLYDWQFTANQFVFASSPLRLTTRIFLSTEPLR
jgi:hypothetical protein